MNAVTARIRLSQTSILSGGHHIVSAARLMDGLKDVAAGMILRQTPDGYAVCTGEPVTIPPEVEGGEVTTEAEEPVAILLEGASGTTSESVQPVAVHGAIKRSKAIFADGSEITDKYIELLRKNGIYVIEG